jgi:hypothetical protein
MTVTAVAYNDRTPKLLRNIIPVLVDNGTLLPLVNCCFYTKMAQFQAIFQSVSKAVSTRSSKIPHERIICQENAFLYVNRRESN